MSSIERKPFFDKLRTRVGHFHESQFKGLELLLEAWEYIGWTDLRWLSYCLGTAWWETGKRMQPVDEDPKDRIGHIYNLPTGPYKLIYYGRGLVQLTWLANYQRATEELNKLDFDLVDLVKDPEQANDPSRAALILYYGMKDGWFESGHTLARYFSDTAANPVGARWIVNRADHADEIAAIYEDFVFALGG